MKNVMILIRSFFLLRPRFLSTIFFIPILYGIGWALSQPLLLFNFEKENLSLIGTIITFLLFILLLPYWFYIKRNKSSAWIILGITKDKFLKNFFNFSQGILFALVLIILILVPLLQKNYISWIGELSPIILLNSIVLGLGVGFAEEIIFRGWLQEELKFEYGMKEKSISTVKVLKTYALEIGIPEKEWDEGVNKAVDKHYGSKYDKAKTEKCHTFVEALVPNGAERVKKVVQTLY